MTTREKDFTAGIAKKWESRHSVLPVDWWIDRKVIIKRCKKLR